MPTLPKPLKLPWIPDKGFSSMKKSDFDYNQRTWRKVSKAYLAQHPLCVECESKGLIVASCVTDHAVPISKGGDPWDQANYQALCRRCHAKKTGSDVKKI